LLRDDEIVLDGAPAWASDRNCFRSGVCPYFAGFEVGPISDLTMQEIHFGLD